MFFFLSLLTKLLLALNKTTTIPPMKIKFPFLIVLIVITLSSCSKYENFAGYESKSEDTLEQYTLASSKNHSTLEDELFEIINTYRASIGLNEMEFESTTYYYATLHTDYMISKGNTSHDNFTQRAENIHLGEYVTEDDFVEMRETRDATLRMPRLIMPSIQVNMRAGHLPEAEENGTTYLKVPVQGLKV